MEINNEKMSVLAIGMAIQPVDAAVNTNSDHETLQKIAVELQDISTSLRNMAERMQNRATEQRLPVYRTEESSPESEVGAAAETQIDEDTPEIRAKKEKTKPLVKQLEELLDYKGKGIVFAKRMVNITEKLQGIWPNEFTGVKERHSELPVFSKGPENEALREYISDLIMTFKQIGQ